MLQQILQDMWVDPDILAELDETQKQTLFCKMREEQVRRWKDWDKKVQDQKDPIKSKIGKPRKAVSFLKGVDGEPWVWVMGEHPDDKTIEEILEKEAREEARKLVEGLGITQNVIGVTKNGVDLPQKVIDMNAKNIKDVPVKEEKLKIEDSLDIYCSVEELMREKVKLKPLKNSINNYSLNHYKTENMYNDSRDILQEISLNTTQKVSQKVALWEKKMMEERIFKTIQKKHFEVAKEAEEAEHKQEEVWREQERKAKQAEQQIREIARKAREEHRLACKRDEGTVKTDTTPTSGQPPSRQAVLDWYRQQEVLRKAGIDQYNNIEPWFHGLITRQEAEEALSNQDNGTFLVRLSEKIWGYTITYRAPDKCKHYLIDASNGHYQFKGNNQVNHNTLGDLISYHTKHSLSGGECLVYPCPRKSDSPALQDLLTALAR